MALVGLDSSVLLSYYASKRPVTASQAPNSPLAQTKTQTPPWNIALPKQQIEDVKARSTDPYFDPKDTSLLAKPGSSSSNAGSELEAILNSTLSKSSAANGANAALSNDNDKLFALYKALNRLDYIAQMANRDGTVPGQLPGLNQSFQTGLSQILSFVNKAQFSNLTVMAGQKSASAQATVSIAYPHTNYVGGAVVSDSKVFDQIPGISANESFTISVTKGGNTTDVVIDLSNISGPLTIDNVDSYVNQQLQAAGFGTRFARVQTGGSIPDGNASWGIQIAELPTESVSLSSAAAAPAVYVAGASGNSTDQQGKLIKLVDLSGNVSSAFSANIAPDSGTAAAKATAVDANGNVYVVGNSGGSFGSEINQGSQDVFLSKYDSAGHLQWTKLLGSADSASAYGLAVDPSSGGVVISGAVTGDLKPTSIGSGTDSFVAKYDAEGNQQWVRQVAPASNDQANSVSVDSQGNVYVGGQTAGTVGAGQTSAGGTDAYIAKLDKKGALLYQRQFGTAGSDTASKTAIAADGNLLVASIQNGHAVLTKYNGADGISMPMWQIDLGDLQGGTIGGIASANGRIYLTGTSANIALDAGGAATVARANSGGTDSFVFAATDAGASATPDFVSYVGTATSDQGGGVSVANGKVYLTGTTTGTFAGETRNQPSTHNIFVAQLGSDGTLDWAHQYGGLDGESQGISVAADATGSSVLDALKLPRGTIDPNQSNALESQTTVRAGDYFTLKIQDKTGTRTAKVTITPGETMRSLALKINGALLFDGKASTVGVKGGQGLKIAVNDGVTVQLMAGSKDFDALAGLGLKPQTLINDGSGNTSSKGNTTGNTTASTNGATGGLPTIGLGINTGLDLLSSTNATHAHFALQGAMSLIKQIYGKLNNPQSAATPQATGPAPAYLQNQFAGYQTALAYLGSLGSTTG